MKRKERKENKGDNEKRRGGCKKRGAECKIKYSKIREVAKIQGEEHNNEGSVSEGLSFFF